MHTIYEQLYNGAFAVYMCPAVYWHNDDNDINAYMIVVERSVLTSAMAILLAYRNL